MLFELNSNTSPLKVARTVLKSMGVQTNAAYRILQKNKVSISFSGVNDQPSVCQIPWQGVLKVT